MLEIRPWSTPVICGTAEPRAALAGVETRKGRPKAALCTAWEMLYALRRRCTIGTRPNSPVPSSAIELGSGVVTGLSPSL